MTASEKSQRIKKMAQEMGFFYTGIAPCGRLDEEARQLERWLSQGLHGTMQWMENYFDLRVDPGLVLPGAQSVICLAHNYYPKATPADQTAPKIARYAYGKDYHRVLKRKLKALEEEMRACFGKFNSRYFVDSGPVLERAWAAKTGLGWTGKNTLTIHPGVGSYFFLAVIICDLDLDHDHPIKDHCGTCNRCITACPTEAIHEGGYWLDATKCIAYLTIELRDDHLPDEAEGKLQNWVFGCDICQEVCPWNRFAQPHTEPSFEPHADLLGLNRQDYQEMDEAQYERLFAGTPVKRAKWSGFKRNIDFIFQKTNEG